MSLAREDSISTTGDLTITTQRQARSSYEDGKQFNNGGSYECETLVLEPKVGIVVGNSN